jgi:ATP phosphoribosyltransferase
VIKDTLFELERLRGRVLGDGESAVAVAIGTDTGGQALTSALNIALARRSHTVIGVDVRALAEASVNAVESALDGHVHILLVDLAVSACVLGVAHAGSVVAPTSIAAVIGACLDAAVIATESWLAPASSVQAKTIVGAVLKAHGDGAVWAVEVGVAHAGTVVAVSVEVAVAWADLDGAVEMCPARGADASVVDTLTSGQTVVGA